MRRLLLLSAVIVAAACSDTQQPTAPASGQRVSAKGSAAGQLAPSPTAKPTDQVGFTKVVRVNSVSNPLDAGTENYDTAQCPAGSVLISGGYEFSNPGSPAAPPFVQSSSPTIYNNWYVRVGNHMAGATAAAFTVFALCAS